MATIRMKHNDQSIKIQKGQDHGNGIIEIDERFKNEMISHGFEVFNEQIEDAKILNEKIKTKGKIKNVS